LLAENIKAGFSRVYILGIFKLKTIRHLLYEDADGRNFVKMDSE